MLPDRMTALAHPHPPSTRRAPPGRGDVVYPAYWVAAAGLIGMTLMGVPLTQPAAALVFIGGGLPHGAYDIALLRRSVALDRAGLWLAIGGYVAIAVLMVALWMTLPLVALVVFLAVASVHFGEDWPMLEEPLLRFAAGAAVIAAATLGHPAEVSALFVAMSDPRAAVIAQIITAAAPVALLVTGVGVALAWRDGSRHWAAAMSLCLVLLVILPPVTGFALFFVFLHSPRHLAQTRSALHDMTLGRWIGTGALLSGLAILGWWGLRGFVPSRVDASLVAQAFQLLASVAVPHLLLSRWIERRLIAVPYSHEKTSTP
ncbi:Brp/Blh family beta-carotene 15,15'-dioxygenase [Sphingomonas sp. AAP5]|uniref:Brp/Blh family beta-carotene 15,15'-dioxygenase n=1 Tax=Sphingomonas sp. AAP5 TaxID=1523415 RepID=UPI001F0F154D|nr:Brp/Blh family beta-carotene 15,15'-dioxygenase [Sphingomonas sp. AAP5]